MWDLYTVKTNHCASNCKPQYCKSFYCFILCILQCKSYNNTVKTISMMGANGLYSVLSANDRMLSTKYGMNLNNILKVLEWKMCKWERNYLKMWTSQGIVWGDR